MRLLKRLWYRLIGMHPGKMPMVSYWKTKDHVEAKLTTKDGATQMVMQGEKYPMWGFPRGHLLIPSNIQHGPLSVLKHEIKQFFNEVWAKNEAGTPKDELLKWGKERLFKSFEAIEPMKYDLMPARTMCPSVREIHRAITAVSDSPRVHLFRDVLTLILQEDDSFRYRVQWLAIWLPVIRWNPVKILDKCLRLVEEGEVIGDMKRRIRLLRTITILMLEDVHIKDLFVRFFREVDWNKVKITEADRYHFRGKYFKVDMDTLEY